MDVLSVGGWGKEHKLAEFSSRGMTTAEIAWNGMLRANLNPYYPHLHLIFLYPPTTPNHS